MSTDTDEVGPLFDLCIDMTRAQRRELTEDYVKRTQDMARKVGRPEFREAA